MRVVMQGLSPGMQDGYKADFSTQMLGISSDRQKSFRDCTKEDAVDGFLILQCEVAEWVRQREDEVEVFDL
jgi:hypothetical protein